LKKINKQPSTYLAINDDDKRWGLYIPTVGFQKIAKGAVYPPKNHPIEYLFDPAKGRKLPEYQCIYIVRGEGYFESSYCKRTKLVSGTMLIIFPNVWHTYMPNKDTGWEVYWLGFNGNMAKHFFSKTSFTPQQAILQIGFNEMLLSLFQQGIDIATAQKIAYQQMLAGITLGILHTIYYAEKNSLLANTVITEKINKAKTLMRNTNYDHLSIQQIAEELNMSYSWFRRVFKEYTGFSPTQYLIEIKIQNAKNLLRNTEQSVKAISFSLQFESTSYFVTLFKEKTGVTPMEYRKNHQVL
jgi:AraC-like DNA-binding protein